MDFRGFRGQGLDFPGRFMRPGLSQGQECGCMDAEQLQRQRSLPKGSGHGPSKGFKGWYNAQHPNCTSQMGSQGSKSLLCDAFST